MPGSAGTPRKKLDITVGINENQELVVFGRSDEPEVIAQVSDIPDVKDFVDKDGKLREGVYKGYRSPDKAVRMLLAFQYRKQGHSYRWIGTKLNVSPVTVIKWISKMLDKVAKQTALESKHLITMELTRLDRMLKYLDDQVREGNTLSIQAALKIMERRSKYLGLDQPAKSLIGEDPENPFDSEMAKQETLTLLKKLAGKSDTEENESCQIDSNPPEQTTDE